MIVRDVCIGNDIATRLARVQGKHWLSRLGLSSMSWLDTAWPFMCPRASHGYPRQDEHYIRRATIGARQSIGHIQCNTIDITHTHSTLGSPILHFYCLVLLALYALQLDQMLFLFISISAYLD